MRYHWLPLWNKKVHAPGCGLEEDVHAFAQQAPGAREDEDPSERRRDRIGSGKPGHGNHDRCRDDSEGPEQVAEHHEVGTPHVEAPGLRIAKSTITRTTQGNEGLIFSNGSNGDLTLHATGNTVTGIGGVAIFAGQTPGNATPSSNLIAVIKNNTITHPTTATNHAIFVAPTSTVGQVSPANILVEGNTVTENSTSGIARAVLVDTPDSNTSPSFTATVLNNVSVGDNVNGVAPLVVHARQSSVGCFDIRGNTASFPNGTPAGVSGIRARQQPPSATANLEQGISSGSAATVLAANNASSTTEVLGTIGVVSNSTCLMPPS